MHSTSSINENTVQEIYETPSMEMLTFNSRDLVTTSIGVESGDPNGSDYGPIIRL